MALPARWYENGEICANVLGDRHKARESLSTLQIGVCEAEKGRGWRRNVENSWVGL